MCNYFLNKVFLLALFFSFSGLSTPQLLAKENSVSDSINSQRNDLCRTLFKGISTLQLTEEDRVSRIEQALDQIESGNCHSCISVVARLLKKDDLKKGDHFKERIDGMIRQRVGCTTLLLPRLIVNLNYKVPLESFDKFDKSSRYDLSERNMYFLSEMSWKKEMINATLFSNGNSKVASKYVVDMLSLFKNHWTFSEHLDLLRAAVECNPLDEDVITEVLSQGIYMRKISLTMGSPDALYPTYQPELMKLKTIVEWNEYKDENFNKVDNYGRSGWSYNTPISWDWEKEGTIDFLNQLLINGFTVVDVD